MDSLLSILIGSVFLIYGFYRLKTILKDKNNSDFYYVHSLDINALSISISFGILAILNGFFHWFKW